MNTGFET